VLPWSGVDATVKLQPAVARVSDHVLVATFLLTSFLAAGLVFLVQPMIAKMLLPAFGGSPAVWNTAMVFFQATLLAGYAFAHFSTQRLGTRRQPYLQAVILLLPLLVLPLALPAGWAPRPDGSQPLALLGILALTVGAPFFVVTTAGPLLQRWFAATDHRAARDPYFLYAAGNAGSLLALLGYPLLVERLLPVQQQGSLWAGGYVVFLVLMLACAALTRWRPSGEESATAPRVRLEPLPLTTRLRWVLLAFIPSSLMLGATTYLSTDVAAVPLLWVVPLALYLLSFVVAFARLPAAVRAAGYVAPALAIAVVVTLWVRIQQPVALIVVLHLLALFAVALLAHGRLAGERPEPLRLTGFYLLLSVGGVLGGIFNALVAPLLFNSLIEYPLVLILALLLVARRAVREQPPSRKWSPDVIPPTLGFLAVVGAGVALLVAGQRAGIGVALAVLVIGGAAACLFFLAAFPARAMLVVGLAAASILLIGAGQALHAERTFFGVYRVVERDGLHILLHGTTAHGVEAVTGAKVGDPLSYYHEDGPIGQVFTSGGTNVRNVALVGLGIGSLTAYGQAGQSFTAYEIDPAVLAIARDPALFTHLERTAASLDVVLGDARLTLGQAPHARYDLIVLDAFTSDAVPVHLLTGEAVSLYADKLARGGLLAFHISNRFLDLRPVLGAAAQRNGLVGLVGTDEVDPDTADGASSSRWVVLARSEDDLVYLQSTPLWSPLETQQGTLLWTDDYSNIFSVVHWW
jgi:spermidine synthase